MRIAFNRITYGLAVILLAWPHAGPSGAQVLGLTIGTPFRPSEPSTGGPAPAYGPYRGPGPSGVEITEAVLIEHLQERGFSRITGLTQKGDMFLCEATGPRRERVRLVLDSRSGEISGVEVIGFENKRYQDSRH
ncbi:MAG: hypothetical protein B7Z45_07050 [Azorhizobium sp. 12-66-6]|nr:MAG: hypothetical protein B7Z45_07050 [Azorhizobium sp. 12-66-6]